LNLFAVHFFLPKHIMPILYEIIDFFLDIRTWVERALSGTYTERILSNTWTLFTGLWYYVLIGAFAAVVVAQLMSYAKVRAFLNRRGGAPIILAAMLGVISPMCTFAAIPLAGGLLAAGVPLAPLMAFVIASPLMNPSLFIITWGVMGPEMALARTFSALFLGILGGFVVEAAIARRVGKESDALKAGFSVSGVAGVCFPGELSGSFRERIASIGRHTVKMTLFISKYFLLALVIAGAVQAIVEPRWIAALLGGGGFRSILLGGLLGIPFYVCGGGTVALIGVLVAMGMGQGAALAFFITGPATKISTIISLNAVFTRRAAAVYLTVTLLGGVLLGWGYSQIAPALKIDSSSYGKVQPKEDSIIYKKGIGAPTGN
jgi:uncharacterized protein